MLSLPLNLAGSACEVGGRGLFAATRDLATRRDGAIPEETKPEGSQAATSDQTAPGSSRT